MVSPELPGHSILFKGVLMGIVRNEILRASAMQGCSSVRQIAQEEADELRNNTIDKFANGKRDALFIWEGFADAVSIHADDGWQWLTTLPEKNSLFLFFSTREERSVFEFRKPIDIVRTLDDAFGFEFYITNLASEFIVCFNHHHYLIATGTMTSWLKNERVARGM